MSYSIIYKRKFIDLKDGTYLPLVLQGDNNVYDAGSKRRSRDWTSLFSHSWNSPAKSKEELLGLANKLIADSTIESDPSYEGEYFKWNGKYVGNKGLLSFINNGIKDAVTMNLLNENNIHVIGRVTLFEYTGEESPTGYRYCKSLFQNNERLYSLDDVQGFLKSSMEYINGLDRDVIPYAYVSIVYPFESSVDVFSRKARKADSIKSDTYYVLRSKYYIAKLTARRLMFCKDAANAKPFPSEKAALKWADKYINNRVYLNDPLTVEQINSNHMEVSHAR